MKALQVPSDPFAWCVISSGPEWPHTMCTASRPGGAALSPRIAWPGGLQTPSGSSWWSLLVDFGVPKYSLYRSLVVEFPQRYGIFKGPVSMFSCFCVSCHGIRSCTFRLAISHECGLNHETIEAVGHYREDFTAS